MNEADRVTGIVPPRCRHKHLKLECETREAPGDGRLGLHLRDVRCEVCGRSGPGVVTDLMDALALADKRIAELEAEEERLSRSRRQWEDEWKLAETNNTDRKAEVLALKARIAELEAENKKLREALKKWQDDCKRAWAKLSGIDPSCELCMEGMCSTHRPIPLRQRIADLEAALSEKGRLLASPGRPCLGRTCRSAGTGDATALPGS